MTDVLVEDLITEIIESRLKFLKDNVDIVDRIFQTSSISLRNKLKSYLKSNQIKVVRGFPRDQSMLPGYVILLGAEREEQQSIGDFLDEDVDIFEVEEETEDLPIKSHGGFFVVQTEKKPINEITSIYYNGMTHFDGFEVLDEQRGIVSLHFPIDLDISNTVEIIYSRKTTGTENYGTLFMSQYRVETWSENGDLTVLLYHLLKWMFILDRGKLAEKGLVKQSYGGLDFEASPDYFPTFVYRRAMTMDVSYEYVIPVEFEGYISEIIDDRDEE